MKHVSVAGNVDKILESSDLVIYGSFLEEQSFPEILMKAMSLGKPIVAPDLFNIRKHVCSFFHCLCLDGNVLLHVLCPFPCSLTVFAILNRLTTGLLGISSPSRILRFYRKLCLK